MSTLNGVREAARRVVKGDLSQLTTSSSAGTELDNNEYNHDGTHRGRQHLNGRDDGSLRGACSPRPLQVQRRPEEHHSPPQVAGRAVLTAAQAAAGLASLLPRLHSHAECISGPARFVAPLGAHTAV